MVNNQDILNRPDEIVTLLLN